MEIINPERDKHSPREGIKLRRETMWPGGTWGAVRVKRGAFQQAGWETLKPEAALAQGRFSGRAGRGCLWDRKAARRALALLGFMVPTENHPPSCAPARRRKEGVGADFVWPDLHICRAQISVPRRELRGGLAQLSHRGGGRGGSGAITEPILKGLLDAHPCHSPPPPSAHSLSLRGPWR